MTPKYIFVDNFRGFQNQTIAFEQVNFLVGENSTGKTSILSLISLFSDMDFWQEQNFSAASNLGHFDEIVSSAAIDRTYFRIGIVASSNQPSGVDVLNAYLLTFRNRAGLPQLTAFSTRQGDMDVTIKINGPQALYKSEAAAYERTPEALVNRLTERWVEQHTGGIGGYETLLRNANLTKEKFGVPLSFFLGQVAGRLYANKPASVPTNDPVFDAIFDTKKVVALAPVRSKPKKTYDEVNREFSPEGEHIPYRLRDMLGSSKMRKLLIRLLDELGQDSHLFDSIEIRKLGRASTAPFVVNIVLDGRSIGISNVGYGVSQAMPILVEMLDTAGPTCFVIQQPEVHLHPRAQAALGGFIFLIAASGHDLLIETHSDFLIDRFRLTLKDSTEYKPNSQVLYFDRRSGVNTVNSIKIASDGSLGADQPSSYRDFFLREGIRTLQV